jgi:hypothetical protein
MNGVKCEKCRRSVGRFQERYVFVEGDARAYCKDCAEKYGRSVDIWKRIMGTFLRSIWDLSKEAMR